TLFEISDLLQPYLMRQDIVMCSAIPVEEQVASRLCYHSLAHIFSKGTSMIASVVVEFCLAMEHTLLQKEIRVPNFNKLCG
ncbi:hypothetical protein JRQ81_009219, partial [Phrynocephalus forsythii]